MNSGMKIFSIFVITLVLRYSDAYRATLRMGTTSIVKDASFLSIRDEDIYLTKVISKSIESVKQCLKDNKQLIEIEFPANRKSDISVTETLARNRIFVRKFIRPFENFGKKLWIIFPDGKESYLAQQDPTWGTSCPFTITTIATLSTLSATEVPEAIFPQLIVAVNPGFNVEEWIQLAKSKVIAPTVVVNGNIDRLRNGYYPSLFYPELTRVSKQYYSQATQALFLSPIAVKGNRFGAWLTKIYSETDWEVIVQKNNNQNNNNNDISNNNNSYYRPIEYEAVLTSSAPPDATRAWQTAKDAYSKNFGGSWF